MAHERRFDRDRAGQDHDWRDHDRDRYRGRDDGRSGYRGGDYRGEAHGSPGYGGHGDYGRAGNIDYGGYPEAALGHGGGGAGYRGGGERSLGYGRGGNIDYGGYPRGALGHDGGREGFGRRSGEEYGRHHGREGDYGGGSYSRGEHGSGFGFGGDLEGVGEYRGRGPLGYSRSDERIREDVCDRLTDDSHLDASAIEVQVSNGEVTLSGTIRHRMDKRRAEDIADDISGVKHVQNNLRVQDRGLSGTPGEAATTARMGQDSTTGATPAAANEPNAKHGRSAA